MPCSIPILGYPDSDALQLFLAQNAQLIYDARVVVLAYTAPYYLDATEISKLTAYYVFYSKVAALHRGLGAHAVWRGAAAGPLAGQHRGHQL